MRKYSILHIPFMSFYSKDLYRDICLKWKGVCFLYLFLLLCLCWTVPIVQTHMGFSDFVKNDSSDYVSQLPTIKINKGRASADVEQPHFIIDPENQETIAIIDTTGQINSLDETDAKILVTETDMFVKKNALETRSFTFRDLDDMQFDQEMAYDILGVVQNFIGISMFLLILPFSFIYRIVLALIYAAIGLLIASKYNSDRSYGELVRLSVVAMTPTIIIDSILGGFGVNIPYSWLLYFIITIGYLIFGVKASIEDDTNIS